MGQFHLRLLSSEGEGFLKNDLENSSIADAILIRPGNNIKLSIQRISRVRTNCSFVRFVFVRIYLIIICITLTHQSAVHKWIENT